MAQITITMEPTAEEFRHAVESDPKKAAQALEPELKRFTNWMMSCGLDPLTRVEHAILKEYLGWKLTNDPESP